MQLLGDRSCGAFLSAPALINCGMSCRLKKKKSLFFLLVGVRALFHLSADSSCCAVGPLLAPRRGEALQVELCWGLQAAAAFVSDERQGAASSLCRHCGAFEGFSVAVGGCVEGRETTILPLISLSFAPVCFLRDSLTLITEKTTKENLCFFFSLSCTRLI